MFVHFKMQVRGACLVDGKRLAYICATTNMKENAIDTLGHGKKVIGHRLNHKKNH